MEFDKLFMSRTGIISMTEADNIPSIWSHYAQNEGFVINFNSKSLKNDSICGPFKVCYSSLQKITVNLKEYGGQFLYRNLLKHKCWCNEEEWRLFYFGMNMSIPYIVSIRLTPSCKL